MTTLTEPTSTRHFPFGKFVLGVLAGLVLALGFGAGALFAYQGQYADRIYPGVEVDGVIVTGETREEATATLRAALTGYGAGHAAIDVDGTVLEIPYGDLGRRADVETLVALAWSVGRDGSDPVGSAAQGVRSLLDGTRIDPLVVLDPDAVSRVVAKAAASIDRQPVDGTATITKDGFATTPAEAGRSLPRDAVARALLGRLADPAAPEILEIAVATLPVEPAVSDAEVKDAVAAAKRMARDIVITRVDEKWKIKAATVRTWLAFAPTADGGYGPSVAATAPTKALKALAKKIDRKAKDASFLVGRSSGVVGVVAAKNGRALDVPKTASLVAAAVSERAAASASGTPPTVKATIAVVKPKLSTEEARKTAPLMKRLASWTTYFHRYEANGFGANISIPTGDIDGYVVQPGAVFDFWKAVGPVTYARGYRDGGAILNGRTEPTGALAGGICSTSTTLFNAAARAGLAILERDNHYYYIDRYPTGLDATVWKTGGSQQSMRFRNDTKYPILIRGYTGVGAVRFEIWGQPTGRTVAFSAPTIRNVVRAIDTVLYTSSLKPGQSKRIEYPVSGMQVWVTRIVRNAKGAVIHRDTWYSDYKRVNGIVLVGRKPAAPAPKPAPKPTPAP